MLLVGYGGGREEGGGRELGEEERRKERRVAQVLVRGLTRERS